MIMIMNWLKIPLHRRMPHVYVVKGKGKVFYDQEPPSGESTTTECGVNYQLLVVMLLK